MALAVTKAVTGYKLWHIVTVLLKAVRNHRDGAVRTPPVAVPIPSVIQLLNVQKGINHTQIMLVGVIFHP